MLSLEEALIEADKIKNVGVIPDHFSVMGQQCVYLKVNSMCYICCEACNLDVHQCYGCGTELDHNGYEWPKDGKRRLHNPPGELNCYEEITPVKSDGN